MGQLSGASLFASTVSGLTSTFGAVSTYKGSGSISLSDLSNPDSELLNQLGYNNSFLSYLTNNFSSIDQDGDGEINASDLSNLTTKIQSEGLSYNEISQLAATGAMSSSLTETVLNYFNKIDKNGDGKVTSAEISAFGFESDRQKMDTKYNSFKGSSISVFYSDENEAEPSSVIDSMYPNLESSNSSS